MAAAADRIYAAALADFVSARKAEAAAARSGGDRSAAAAIAALPQPSTAAWVVNLLARERSDVIDSLVALGESLREAQDGVDPTALRTLGDQRRRLVGQIARRAAGLAEEQVQKVGPSIREDVEQILQAALGDPDAAEAVRSGRLVRALAPNGFDAVDVSGAVAGVTGTLSPAGSSRRGSAARTPGSATSSASDELAEARRRKEEQERRREADHAAAELAAAEGRLGRADSARAEAERHRDDLRAQRDELRARLDEVEDRLAEASAALRTATKGSSDAADALASARDADSRARVRVDALRDRAR